MLGWGVTYRSVGDLNAHISPKRLTQAHLQRWVWLTSNLVYNCLVSHETTNLHAARTELHMSGRETWEQEETRLPAILDTSLLGGRANTADLQGHFVSPKLL